MVASVGWALAGGLCWCILLSFGLIAFIWDSPQSLIQFLCMGGFNLSFSGFHPTLLGSAGWDSGGAVCVEVSECCPPPAEGGASQSTMPSDRTEPQAFIIQCKGRKWCIQTMRKISGWFIWSGIENARQTVCLFWRTQVLIFRIYYFVEVQVKQCLLFSSEPKLNYEGNMSGWDLLDSGCVCSRWILITSPDTGTCAAESSTKKLKSVFEARKKKIN